MYDSYSEYVRRLNTVIDYIEENLDTDLNLDTLADVAHFSKFHFHKVFNSFVGEPLAAYIRRIRLERAAYILVTRSGISIADVAHQVGFSGSDTFARTFKSHFGVSASKYRLNKKKIFNTYPVKSKNTEGELRSKIGLPERENNIDGLKKIDVIHFLGGKFNEDNVKVTVKPVDEFTVAYVRHIGPFRGDIPLFWSLWLKLFNWAAKNNIEENKNTKYVTIYHNDPEITGVEKLRLSICMSVDPDTEVEGDIGKMEIHAQLYACAEFELTIEEHELAWGYIYGEWLPNSGYEPVNSYPFEVKKYRPGEYNLNKHKIEIYIPVKPI